MGGKLENECNDGNRNSNMIHMHKKIVTML